MKKYFSLLAVCMYALCAFSQEQTTASTHSFKIFSETDLGVLLMSGGDGRFNGVVTGPYRISLGYYSFNSPSKSLGGVPDGFSLRVDYLFSLNIAYFLNGNNDNGFYLQGMYQNKKQIVTNSETRDSQDLFSDLLGIEAGYVWKMYKGLYLAPRIGALYYVRHPQGTNNTPVLIGNKFYDNDRHKTWDTYFIPTVSIGYTATL